MNFAGIEAGGTKFICGVGSATGEIFHSTTFATTDPEMNISQVIHYFQAIRSEFAYSRIGLACFGPVDLNPLSGTYGHITSTPKSGWQNVNIKGALENALDTGVVMDTDVNAAALAEYTWGNARGKELVVYLTIGTGIGGGILMKGVPMHGLLHPEMGHMRIRTDAVNEVYPGICPFHANCLEGLASGRAIQARWKLPAESIPPDHPAWKDEVVYLSEGIANIILVLSPEVIILGGGVMQRTFLFPLIRNRVRELLNGYIEKKEILENIEEFILPAKLGGMAGLLGAIALASGAGS